jgi:hypothetical protein
MSSTNNLESRMSGWTPRPASPQLRDRLFAQPQAAPAVDLGASVSRRSSWSEGILRSVAPVGAMALVLMAGCLARVPDPSAIAQFHYSASELTNGCSDAVFGQVYAHSTLNHCSAPIFGSTNPVVHPESTPLFRQ